MGKLLVKFLPTILEFIINRIAKAINDEKETRFDKTVKFLLSDNVDKVVDKFVDSRRKLKRDVQAKQ